MRKLWWPVVVACLLIGTLTPIIGQTFLIRRNQIQDAAINTAKIDNLAVTTAKLADGSVTTGKIADGTLADADIAAAAITASKISPTGGSDGQVLKRVAGVVTWSTDSTTPGGGTGLTEVSVTSPLAGNGQSGDPINITAGGIGATQLADNGVTTAKINDNAVTTAKINNGAVTTAKLASAAVTTVNIAVCADQATPVQNTWILTMGTYSGSDCLRFVPSGSAPAAGSTTTFARDNTRIERNPGRGLVYDRNGSDGVIYPWDSASQTSKKAGASVFKWDFNWCDGVAAGPSAPASCAALNAVPASAQANLTNWCNNFRTNKWKVIIRHVQVADTDAGTPYVGQYVDIPPLNYQNMLNSLEDELRLCEDISLVHYAGFANFGEQWGPFQVAAHSGNNYSYAGATIARNTFDSILLTKQQCMRRPDYHLNIGIPWPITDLSTVFSTTGGPSTCFYQDAPMSDNNTEAGTYGVNSNNDANVIASQKANAKLHSKYTNVSGEFWESGISGSSYQTFAAATQYFRDYHWNAIRMFAHAGLSGQPANNICTANPCSNASGLLGSLNDGAGTTLGQWLDRKLGYRYSVSKAVLPANVTRGTPFSWQFDMYNDGLRSTVEPRLFQLVLKNGSNIYRFDINADPLAPGIRATDPRSWFRDETTTVSGQFTFSTTVGNAMHIPAGTYSVHIGLPDYYGTLRTVSNIGDYSIQLLNLTTASGGNGAVTWDATNGLNNLLNTSGNPIQIVVN